MFSAHGGIPMSRKCDFNNQFKGELTRKFTRGRCRKESGGRRRTRPRNGDGGTGVGAKRGAERGLTESVHDLALSQVCTTGGAQRKEAVHAYAARAQACVRWCMCACV